MNPVLGFWNREWQSVDFDPPTGACSVRWLRRKSGRSLGWAYRLRRRWYCLWNDNGRLVFQQGVQRFPLGAPWLLRQQPTAASGSGLFTVTDGRVVALEVRYKLPSNGFLARRDLTWDDVDEEGSDFFLWLSRLAADPKRQEAWAERS